MERFERCLNNKNRIIELERKLEAIDIELENTRSQEDVDIARDDMVFVKNLGIAEGASGDEMSRVYKIADQYKFEYNKCQSLSPPSIKYNQYCINYADLWLLLYQHV